MTEEQKEWFEKLSSKRKKFADLSQDPDYRGMWEVLIKGIYSKDAHFIYELLQNAEDVKATSVKFILKKDGLFFIHNGTIGFTITDIENLKENGHINAITAVGRTGKKISETIGKFGIGFKAVFQYTKTPHIYEPKFQFKIYDYIVPELLENSQPDIKYDREKDTVFYFPFIGEEEQTDDNKVKPKNEAYDDISTKLKNLDKPTLFLSNLEEIKWQIGSKSNAYKKEILETKKYKDVEFNRIKLSPDDSEYIIFTRFEKEVLKGIELDYNYSVGFKIEKGKLEPIENSCAYCFFPTAQETKLNFLFHAPFLLNSNRESIPKNLNLKLRDDNGNEFVVRDSFNEVLILQLSKLTADSLLILKGLKLINDDITEIIPYQESEQNDFFAPFYEAIKEKFKTEEIVPAKRGYTSKECGYWASVSKIAKIFSNKQLTAILESEEKCKWVFPSKGRNETLRVNGELARYIESISNGWLNEDDLLEGWVTDDGDCGGITGKFIEKQNLKWLKRFYEWIIETDGRRKLSKNRPFFLNKDGKAVSAFDNNGKLILFFPDEDGEGYETLNVKLFNLVGKELFEKFGIREHTVADGIEDAIESIRNKGLNPISFFTITFKYFKNECPQDKIKEFIGKIKNIPFIPCYSQEKQGGGQYCIGADCFYPTIRLVQFYEEIPTIKFANVNKLQSKYPKDEYKILDDFLDKLGVDNKEPNLEDEIYKIVIPQLEEDGEVDTIDLFKKIFQYYRECKNEEIDEFIEDIKDLEFILYKSDEDETVYRGIANEIYFPTDDLVDYFKSKPDTKFIVLEKYNNIYSDEKNQKLMREFLMKLGLRESPRIIRLPTRKYIWSNRDNDETKIEHCFANLDDTFKEKDSTKSLLIWRVLSKMNLKEKLNEKETLDDLRTVRWLLTKEGDFVKPDEITINDLDEIYNKNDYELVSLLDFQSIIPLTEEEWKLLVFEEFEEEGYDAEKIRELIEKDKAEKAEKAKEEKEKRDEENKKKEVVGTDGVKGEDGVDEPDPLSKLEIGIKSLEEIEEVLVKSYTRRKPGSKTTSQTGRLDGDGEPKKPNGDRPNDDPKDGPKDVDSDKEFLQSITKQKEEFETKRKRIELIQKMKGSKEYSYNWFKAYLNLLNTYSEKQGNQEQKSISFQEIKRYKADNKFFLLRGASGYISSEIENSKEGFYEVVLVFGNGDKETIEVEGVSKKGQDLLIYCRKKFPTNLLSRLSKVFKVEINFKPITDLIGKLITAFENTDNIDDWDVIQDEMPSLHYIYGPPGTGKTTEICKKISKALESNPNTKILVLTPTNKAADVVCKKLFEINEDIKSVRLSSPTDYELEELGEGIYRDSLEINDFEEVNVVASTIHRLPYFGIKESGLLFQYKWDCVIFDEASMIGLHYITFALMALSKTYSETEFIVSGDPKQIPPVIEIDDKELERFDFQELNIYKMMKLESFNPEEQKIRSGKDSIQNLNKQYRSIPQIGQLFSEFSYSGLLKHDRETNRKEVKILPEEFKKIIFSNVTFLDIPLNKDNSIYKVNQLSGSSYHIYCSILVAEMIKYLDAVNKEEQWTIGLIAPYKTQAILLNKLITSYGISENIKVYADTVHGFQGDECDIVFFVCNPNNYYYTGHPKALVSKEYIYNVAISRARDYLVILHPYSDIIDNEFINKIKASYKGNLDMDKVEILDNKKVEKVLFGKENYIEANSYVSGHDSVNIFGLSEMKYFIKANDTAIDIQLRDLESKENNNLTTSNEVLKEEFPNQNTGVKIIGKIDLSQFDKYKRK